MDPEDFDGAYSLGVSGAIWPPNIDNAAGAMIGKFLKTGKPVAAVLTDLNLGVQGAGHGLLITGDRSDALILAAKFLLGSLLSL